jgi:hypothetical protein
VFTFALANGAGTGYKKGMPIVEGIAAAKAAFEVSKIALDLTRHPKLDNDAIHARLLELQGLILSAQSALGDALEENRKLASELQEEKRRGGIGEQFTFEEGVYWHRNYPYCPNCWDCDRKPIRLDGPYATNTSNTSWNCSQHKSRYYLKRRQWE